VCLVGQPIDQRLAQPWVENGRLVVTLTAAFSARSAITWNVSSHAVSASGT
jgi:hypothetical protein